METQCPQCHTTVRPTDYFCYNCGHNLKPAAPSMSFTSQATLYIKSVFVPPFGIFWAIKYLKQTDSKSRMVGIIAVILTVTSFIISIILFKNFVADLNTQVNQQLDLFNY
ncbi:MAG: zinc ribbon domain-containing protein [bacterium]